MNILKGVYSQGLRLLGLCLLTGLWGCGGGSSGGSGGGGPGGNSNPPENTNQPPVAVITANPASGSAPLTVSLDGSGSTDADGSISSWAWEFGDGQTGGGEQATHVFATAGTYTVKLVVTDDRGDTAQASASLNVSAPLQLPTNPSQVAPKLTPGSGASMSDASRFLTEGNNPIQQGADTATFDPVRNAVLRGMVTDTAGNPLSGVTVSVNKHPAYGQTLSREDGLFDLRVNGDETLILRYWKTGFLPAQRGITVDRQEYNWLPDVSLVMIDPKATTVDTSGSADSQTVRGSVVSDDDGSRQATLLLPAGLQASLVQSDGSSVPTSQLTMRLTEYTTGGQGLAAMPGELPPASGFTYAVELGSEQARHKVDGRDVILDRPAPFYVENFLNFPVGSIVPVGYYNNTSGKWQASENGRVIGIVAVTGNRADVDVDGDNTADSGQSLIALGITDEELRQLGGLYKGGDTLWRVRVRHFSTYDCNWPYGPPADAEKPGQMAGEESDLDASCYQCGSIIETENQALGERLSLVGSPYSLNYRSVNMQGHSAFRKLAIPLTSDNPPASLKRVELQIMVAGQRQLASFPKPAANLSTTFVWDGKDAYGRMVNGTRKVRLRVGYVYDAAYMDPGQQAAAFGLWSGTPIEGSRARGEFILWSEYSRSLTSRDARQQGLGGWTLSVHHYYDPVGKVLYLGSGQRRHAEQIPSTIYPYAGTVHGRYSGDGGPAVAADLHQVSGIAVAPDGTVYMSETWNDVVRAVTPDGIIRTVAGNGNAGFLGDGGQATQAELKDPMGLAVAADGSLFIADRYNQRIRRVDAAGIITTVAGNGSRGDAGDGGPAIQAELGDPSDVAFGPDGALYVADARNGTIRRLDASGKINTVAGNGRGYGKDDGLPALQHSLGTPVAIAFNPAGGLFILDHINHLFLLGPDGRIDTVAGGGSPLDGLGDGLPATEARLSNPTSVVVGRDGSVYIADRSAHRVRRVDPEGTITTFAGTGTSYHSNTGTGDNGAALAANLNFPGSLAFGPDGTLYVGESTRVRRIVSGLPGFDGDNLLVAAADGRQVYEFSATGRHLASYNALTGAALYRFGYDENGYLTDVVDGDGRTLSVARKGTALSINTSNGQATKLAMDSDGYLTSLTSPGGAVWQFSYTNGLLTGLTDPDDYAWQFAYDNDGRLRQETLPGGGIQTLSRSRITEGFRVDFSDGADRNTRYDVSYDSLGTLHRNISNGEGETTAALIEPGGAITVEAADGTLLAAAPSGDPRFGLAAPVLSSASATTPAGLTRRVSKSRSVEVNGSPLDVNSWNEETAVNGVSSTLSYKPDAVGGGGMFTQTTLAGRIRKAEVDGLGRPLKLSPDDSFGITPVSYTWQQGLLRSVEQGSEVTAFSYDNRGYLQQIVLPDGRRTVFTQDADGRVTTVSGNGNRTVRFAYSLAGRLTSLTLPSGAAHGFSWGDDGLLADYTPPGTGGSYQFDRDGSGLISGANFPSGKSALITYDTAGRINALQSDPLTINFAYNNGLFSHSFWKVDNRTQECSITYDGFLPTVLSCTGEAPGSYQYVYDDAFHLVQVSFGSYSDTIENSADGLQTSYGPFTLRRDGPDAAVDSITATNLAIGYSYDNKGRLLSKTLSVAGTVRYKLTLVREAGGRIITKSETVAGTTHNYQYAYDVYGQMISVTKDGSISESYSYDSNLNPSLLPAGEAHYDQRDGIKSLAGTSYTVDADGFVTARGADHFNWDTQGDLLSATVGTATVSYSYDGLGRRVARRTASGTESYYYGNWQLPYQITAYTLPSGTTVIAYYDDMGHLFALHQGVSWYYVGADQLGSPRAVFDASGNLVRGVEREAFGQIASDTNSSFRLPVGFSGGIEDPLTGWVRLWHRDLDTASARWTAIDPLLFDGGLTALYTYVHNDPVNRTDPTGLEECEGGYNPPGRAAQAMIDAVGWFSDRYWDVKRWAGSGLTSEANARSSAYQAADIMDSALQGTSELMGKANAPDYITQPAGEGLHLGLKNIEAYFHKLKSRMADIYRAERN